jgi:hypothetical protein
LVLHIDYETDESTTEFFKYKFKDPTTVVTEKIAEKTYWRWDPSDPIYLFYFLILLIIIGICAFFIGRRILKRRSAAQHQRIESV